MDPNTKRTLQCRQVNWVLASLELKKSMIHPWMKKIRLMFLHQILQMRLNLLLSVEEIIIITQRLSQINILPYKLKTLMNLKVMVYHTLRESANRLLQWKIRLYIVLNLRIVDVLQEMNMLILLCSKKLNSLGMPMIS